MPQLTYEIRAKINEAREQNKTNPIGSAGFNSLADAVEMIVALTEGAEGPNKTQPMIPCTGESPGKHHSVHQD